MPKRIKEKLPETKESLDIKRCKELLKKDREKRAKEKKPETTEQKIKKAEKTIIREYKKIQNNVSEIDDIKKVVDSIREEIGLELGASPDQAVYDDETQQLLEPIEQGVITPNKYGAEEEKALVNKAYEEMDKLEEVINELPDLDDFYKYALKNMERKNVLIKINNDEKLPELFKLEVLKKVNDEVLKREYTENPIMTVQKFKDFTKDFKLDEIFDNDIYTPDREDRYIEHNRFIKDILTSFVNDEMLTTNEHQILLMSVVYKHMNPWLKKRNARLIFYGGNLMRQIHRNINEYFDPESQDIFEKFFGAFVKKSDNDFSLMLGKNPLQMGKGNVVKQYDDYHNKCFMEVSVILEKIRDELMSDLYSHFSFFKYSEDYKKNEYRKLKLFIQEAAAKIDSRIKIDNVKINNRADQLLLFPDNTVELKLKETIHYYKNSESNVIFNSYNNALHFANPTVAHFTLLRSKINFEIEGTFIKEDGTGTYDMNHQYGGELIDFGMPYLMDDGAHGLLSKKRDKSEGNDWQTKWLNRKVEVVHNKEPAFDYMLFGNRYQVELLFFILFWVPGRPWLALKYDKRVARSILFEFYWLLDQYPVGVKSLKTIKKIFKNMSSDSLKKIDKETKLARKTIKTDEDRRNYKAWVNTLELYIGKITEGIDSLIDFFSGKKRITRAKLFKLNIVGS